MVSAWAECEVASVEFGDQRLNMRAATLLSALGDRPNLSIPAACRGRAEMEAAYRFFDNEKVTFQKVLAPHRQRTLERMAEQKVVLMVQDSTEVDLTRPNQEVEGAGELDGVRRGVLLHVMHAFTPDGTPLGTAWAEVINRPEVSRAPRPKKRQELKRTPIEKKESMRWLTGLRRARDTAAELPQSQVICIGDSEADIYECFAEPRSQSDNAPALHWLVRAAQERALEPQDNDEHRRLLDAVMAEPALYKVKLLIRGRKPKTAAENRSRRTAREDREAEVEVRAAKVTLRPPWRCDRKLPPVTVNVVVVREPNPPAGESALEWILVTTLPIDTLEQVRQVVEYYCARWNIEIVFRTLKSGCRVEQRRFEHIDRVLPSVAMYLIVAWRTLFVCRMGREFPDADCEVLFEPSEWKAVWAAVHREKPPKEKPRLAEMVHLIAQLGGYIERRDSEPGPQTVWIGLQRMYDLAWAWQTFGPEAKWSG